LSIQIGLRMEASSRDQTAIVTGASSGIGYERSLSLIIEQFALAKRTNSSAR